ncbi:MAG: hypothetical protein DWQ53_09835 [Microcystis flos-aquae DF17]|nr:MAG: hypothetical protein DWQ53_09835 [Microcystis flos-aquae DF17]
MLKVYDSFWGLSGKPDCYAVEWRCPECGDQDVEPVGPAPLFLDGGPSTADELSRWWCSQCDHRAEGSRFSGQRITLPFEWWSKAEAAARTVKPGRLGSETVYVCLLTREEEPEIGLYVGMTGLTPIERFRNHKAGHKASKWVRKFGVGLLPQLTEHLLPMHREAALATEDALRSALRQAGLVWVEGH